MNAFQVVAGKFRTRNQRVVVIDSSREVFDAEQPGMAPTRRDIWTGWLFKADGRTADSRHDWEPDGRFRTPNGVATEYDLRELIEAAPPAPEPTPAPTDDTQDLAHVLLDYADPADQGPFDTLNRLLADRDHGLAICGMLKPSKRPGESDADALQRLITDSFSLSKSV